MHDVLVVGCGPAGSALAAALAQRDVDVAVLADTHHARWPQTYGIWVDEFAGSGLDAGIVLRARYDDVAAAFDGPPRSLGRPYGLIDNDRLQAVLRDRCAAGGVALVAGRARSVRHDPDATTVTTVAGDAITARIVIDASGHRPALARSGAARRPPAQQTAFGLLGRFTTPPVPSGSAVLMDYRSDHLGAAGDRDPTFLYGMDLGGGRFFVEETSLARRPGLGVDVLEQRLHARLRAGGAPIAEIEAVERCHFPMGGPLPPRRQRVVAFGGAARLVHPATGYQVGAALQRAPRLAAAIVEGLRSGTRGAQLAAAGWDAVWPVDLVRQRALHEFGLETLLGLDGPLLRRFFATFFALPDDDWRGYVSGAPSARRVATTMGHLFVASSPPLRRALLASVGRNGLALMRDLRRA